MNYFRILRLALAKAYIEGKFTKEQASKIAQRINGEQSASQIPRMHESSESSSQWRKSQ